MADSDGNESLLSCASFSINLEIVTFYVKLFRTLDSSFFELGINDLPIYIVNAFIGKTTFLCCFDVL